MRESHFVHSREFLLQNSYIIFNVNIISIGPTFLIRKDKDAF